MTQQQIELRAVLPYADAAPPAARMLRRLALAGLLWSLAHMPYAAYQVYELPVRAVAGDPYQAAASILFAVTPLAQALLIVGCIGLLRLKNWGRRFALGYAIVYPLLSAAVQVMVVALHYRLVLKTPGLEWSILLRPVLTVPSGLAHSLIVPALCWFYLMSQPVREALSGGTRTT